MSDSTGSMTASSKISSSVPLCWKPGGSTTLIASASSAKPMTASGRWARSVAAATPAASVLAMY